MKRFILMTQDNCPNCEKLKLMLAKPLKGEFDHAIRIVHRQVDEQDFDNATHLFGVSSTPALIDTQTGQQCRSLGIGEVRKFLTQD